MIQKQILDITTKNHKLTIKKLKTIHTLKTKTLIQTSLHYNTILTNTKNSQLTNLNTYTHNIKLTFQITNNILNIKNNPTIINKTINTNQLHTKNTYPSILKLETSKHFSQKLINQTFQTIKTFNKNTNPLHTLTTYIIERKK